MITNGAEAQILAFPRQRGVRNEVVAPVTADALVAEDGSMIDPLHRADVCHTLTQLVLTTDMALTLARGTCPGDLMPAQSTPLLSRLVA